MSAMVLSRAGEPLCLESRPVPKPGDHELLLEVAACGVCRTDLHVADGDIHGPLPIVPGHEIVGRVVEAGREAGDFAVGDRVGVPWLGGTWDTASFACEGRKISAMRRPSPASAGTVGSRPMLSQTAATAFGCRNRSETWKRHHYCALA